MAISSLHCLDDKAWPTLAAYPGEEAVSLAQAEWWAHPASPSSSIQPPPHTSAHSLPPALTCPTCHFKSWRLPALPLPPQPGCLSGSWGRGGGTGPASWVLRLCSWLLFFFVFFFVLFFCHGTGQATGGKLGKCFGGHGQTVHGERYLSLRNPGEP